MCSTDALLRLIREGRFDGCFASLYGALTSIDTTSGNHDYLYLLLFTTSGSSIPSFLTFIALLGPFVGLSLGFDGIIGEKSERTLYRLTAQPIYRDSIINGKLVMKERQVLTLDEEAILADAGHRMKQVYERAGI